MMMTKKMESSLGVIDGDERRFGMMTTTQKEGSVHFSSQRMNSFPFHPLYLCFNDSLIERQACIWVDVLCILLNLVILLPDKKPASHFLFSWVVGKKVREEGKTLFGQKFNLDFAFESSLILLPERLEIDCEAHGCSKTSISCRWCTYVDVCRVNDDEEKRDVSL